MISDRRCQFKYACICKSNVSTVRGRPKGAGLIAEMPTLQDEAASSSAPRSTVVVVASAKGVTKMVAGTRRPAPDAAH